MSNRLAAKAVKLNPSATRLSINVAGFAGFVGALLCFSSGSGLPPYVMAIGCIGAYAGPVLILELLLLRVHRRLSTGLDFCRPPQSDPARVFVKLVGLYGTMAAAVVGYWLLPEFAHDEYASFWHLVRSGWLPLTLGAVPYFILIDRYMIDPCDGYWHAGLVVVGRWREIDGAVLRRHGLEWLIKAFFLPLMFIQLAAFVESLTKLDYSRGFIDGYVAMYDFLYAADVVIACTGYIFTLRLLDSHIRTIDPTPGGWLVAIICYGPFWVFAYAAIFDYERNGITWAPWLAGHPALQVVWGTGILVFTSLYVAAHLTFGLRFSNLTNRGILTGGLYAITKHPSYVAKNISWWMISIPFVATTAWPDALRNCLLLLAVNAVYFLRARTEERHLASDPEYVRYALAMNERSIFGILGRAFPALRFRAPGYQSCAEITLVTTGSPAASQASIPPRYQ